MITIIESSSINLGTIVKRSSRIERKIHILDKNLCEVIKRLCLDKDNYIANQLIVVR